MSDETVDAGGRLWARPEAPDLEGAPVPDGGAAWTPPVIGPEAELVGPGPRVPPPLPHWWVGFAAYVSVVAVIAVLGAVIVGTGLIGSGDLDAPAVNIGGTYLQDALLFVAALLFARLGTGPGGLRTLGWVRVHRPWVALGLIAGVLVAFFVLSGIYGQLVGIDNGSEETIDALGLRDSDVALVFSGILLVLVAPLVEETVFRGLLFGALWRWKGWVFGAVISGIVFGGIHAGGAAVEALPVLAVLGFGLAFLYWYTGSLLPGIALHAFNNALTLTVTIKPSAGVGALIVIGGPVLAVLIARPFCGAPAVRARA